MAIRTFRRYEIADFFFDGNADRKARERGRAATSIKASGGIKGN